MRKPGPSSRDLAMASPLRAILVPGHSFPSSLLGSADGAPTWLPKRRAADGGWDWIWRGSGDDARWGSVRQGQGSATSRRRGGRWDAAKCLTRNGAKSLVEVWDNSNLVLKFVLWTGEGAMRH